MCPQSGPSVIAILDVRQELLSADCKVTGSRRACNRRTVVVVTVVVVAVAVGVVVVVVVAWGPLPADLQSRQPMPTALPPGPGPGRCQLHGRACELHRQDQPTTLL